MDANSFHAPKDAAKVIVALLEPASLVAAVFGFWRLGVDLDWTANFPISSGIFSHWLVWIALAIAIYTSSIELNRRAGSAQPIPADSTGSRAHERVRTPRQSV